MIRIGLLLVLVGCAAEPASPPPDPQGMTLLGQAQRAYRQGAYATALALADSAAPLVPQLAEVPFLRGLVLAELYDYAGSDAAYGHAIALNPAYRSVRYNLGHNAFLQNAYREALRHYRAEEHLLRDALKESPPAPADRQALAAVLLQIGRTYSRLTRADSARLTYEQALVVDTANAQGYAWLAELDQEAGQLDAALVHARHALAREPQHPDYQLLTGRLLVQMGRPAEALPYLEAVVGARPWERSAHYNLGRALVATGQAEAGARHLARADTLEGLRSHIALTHQGLIQNPDDTLRWENYAYLLYQAGREAESRQALHVLRYLQTRKSLPEAP
jgi:tetratricopeptide (TPR) repeat protein